MDDGWSLCSDGFVGCVGCVDIRRQSPAKFNLQESWSQERGALWIPWFIGFLVSWGWLLAIVSVNEIWWTTMNTPVPCSFQFIYLLLISTCHLAGAGQSGSNVQTHGPQEATAHHPTHALQWIRTSLLLRGIQQSETCSIFFDRRYNTTDYVASCCDVETTPAIYFQLIET